MKILVSTKLTQGHRPNDFSFPAEGELVMAGTECDKEAVDGSCGCKRSLVGMDCWKATTTFRVVDSNLSEEEFIDGVRKSLVGTRWYTEPLKQADLETIKETALKMLEVADFFPVGAVLEKRGTKICVRKIAAKRRELSRGKNRGL